jgi:hypothetical protein
MAHLFAPQPSGGAPPSKTKCSWAARSSRTDWRTSSLGAISRSLLRQNLPPTLALDYLRKKKSGGAIEEAELRALGNAEDYLRVSSNMSSLLELLLATDHGVEVAQVSRLTAKPTTLSVSSHLPKVFTFASATMPIIAVLLTAKVADSCTPALVPATFHWLTTLFGLDPSAFVYRKWPTSVHKERGDSFHAHCTTHTSSTHSLYHAADSLFGAAWMQLDTARDGSTHPDCRRPRCLELPFHCMLRSL